MRYLLTWSQRSSLDACRLTGRDGLQDTHHLWTVGNGTLFCQGCTLVIDFKDGKPILDAADARGREG